MTFRYKSVKVEDGIPFDEGRGIVPNVDGKVEPGLYCAGWLATGPRGVIVDTMTASYRIGQVIATELEANATSEVKAGYSNVEQLFGQRNVKPVYFPDWENLDLKEKELGEQRGKPREKFTDVNDMMSYIRKD